MFEPAISEGVFQLTAPDTRWLSTGWAGGYRNADAAYNVAVPEGWDRENLGEYVDERRERAGFERVGPTLLTGVALDHARGARMGPVEVYATVGLSNPATLPMDGREAADFQTGKSTGAGTVNLIVGTTRPLTDGALATLVATAVEAKTATLLSLTGFTGTTTDAVVAGTPATDDRERVQWTGSGTAVGNAARVCVRDATCASLRSRYTDRDLPETVDEAQHGIVTGGDCEVFEP